MLTDKKRKGTGSDESATKELGTWNGGKTESLLRFYNVL